jgi:hypothetical protein
MVGTDALALTAGTVDSRPGIIEGRKPLPVNTTETLTALINGHGTLPYHADAVRHAVADAVRDFPDIQSVFAVASRIDAELSRLSTADADALAVIGENVQRYTLALSRVYRAVADAMERTDDYDSGRYYNLSALSTANTAIDFASAVRREIESRKRPCPTADAPGCRTACYTERTR